MKKRIFAFIGVLVIVASVFVLPMSADAQNQFLDLDNISLNFLGYYHWNGDFVDGENKVNSFIDNNSVMSFHREGLVDIANGGEEVGSYKKALQSSKVLLTFSTPNSNPSSTAKFDKYMVVSAPKCDVYWWTGSEDPHMKIECYGSSNSSIEDNRLVLYNIYIRTLNNNFLVDCKLDWYINGETEADSFNESYSELNIYLCKTTSIQDMSFNRLFNNIGGWQLDFPNQDSNAWQEGFDFGYQSGEIAGIEIGKADGIEIGREEGIEIGREEGIEIGREEGEEIGYKEGYAEAVKTLDTSGAWANFKDLIFAIFDAPFYVISQALSFEVFGINIASTIIGLISTALIVWILKIIIVKLF